MSLLMDALKRAEENKQGASRPFGTSPPTPSDSGLSLEPLNDAPTGAPAPQSLPDLAEHLAAVDADLAAAVEAPPKKHLPPKEETPLPSTQPHATPREAAQALFAAKTPPAASRAPLYLTLAVLGVTGIAIGLYFWWQLQGLNSGTASRPPAIASVRPAPPPAPLPTAPTPVTTLERQPAAVPPAADYPSPRPQAELREREAPPSSPIRLTRGRNEVDPNLARAWRNLQAGAVDAARQDYEQALKHDPKNVDALLGLAAIAQRQGRQTDAERLQQQANAADPKDAAAQAALLGQSAANDPQGTESRLKLMLSEQPQSAALNFALGNLYAGRGNWGEAQQAYFNAVASEGDNPDYLFNLAISLDRLRQPKIAAQYYRQALEAAEKRPPAFAPEQARQRLDQLLRALQP